MRADRYEPPRTAPGVTFVVNGVVNEADGGEDAETHAGIHQPARPAARAT
jgi:hypothetical protein